MDAEKRKTAGHTGGSMTKQRHGTAFYARIGRKGGASCAEKHGPDHYQAIGRKGGNRVRDLCAKAKALEAGE